jgi:hypothetical protein
MAALSLGMGTVPRLDGWLWLIMSLGMAVKREIPCPCQDQTQIPYSFSQCLISQIIDNTEHYV